MPRKIHIGDLTAIKGEPPGGNPYRAEGAICQARVEALRAFRDGSDTGDYTFWYVPSCGGARRVTNPDEVDWGALNWADEQKKRGRH